MPVVVHPPMASMMSDGHFFVFDWSSARCVRKKFVILLGGLVLIILAKFAHAGIIEAVADPEKQLLSKKITW